MQDREENMGNINKVNKRYVWCYGDVNKGINYRECALSSLWEIYYIHPHPDVFLYAKLLVQLHKKENKSIAIHHFNMKKPH